MRQRVEGSYLADFRETTLEVVKTSRLVSHGLVGYVHALDLAYCEFLEQLALLHHGFHRGRCFLGVVVSGIHEALEFHDGCHSVRHVWLYEYPYGRPSAVDHRLDRRHLLL